MNNSLTLDLDFTFLEGGVLMMHLDSANI